MLTWDIISYPDTFKSSVGNTVFTITRNRTNPYDLYDVSIRTTIGKVFFEKHLYGYHYLYDAEKACQNIYKRMNE